MVIVEGRRVEADIGGIYGDGKIKEKMMFNI